MQIIQSLSTRMLGELVKIQLLGRERRNEALHDETNQQGNG